MDRLSIIAALLGLAVTATPALALDKQGKRSLETSTSRPKENAPAKTGAQRVQDQTSSRTSDALNKTGSARQQEKTRAAADKALKK